MRVASFFSGIGGFDLGLERAGHRVVYACEIDPFAREVYRVRFGRVPEGGDINHVRADEIPHADLWCAGSPCQDFSSSGPRLGFTGDRSSLILRWLDLAAERGVEWLLWENVPGVFTGRSLESDYDAVGESAEDASWFAAVLGAFRQRGFVGGAWRTLDAVRFGVAQYRRRVFVLARRSRDGTRPREVLLDQEDMRRDLASCLAPRSKAPLAPALSTRATRASGEDEAVLARCAARTLHGVGRSVNPEDAENLVLGVPTLRASDDDRRSPNGDAAMPCVFDLAQVTSPENRSAPREGAPSVELGARTKQAVVYNVNSHGSRATDSFTTECGSVGETLVLFDADKDSHGHGTSEAASSALRSQRQSSQAVEDGLRPRRLTPREWERLQAFPDDWTAIPWRGHAVAADSPRYEAIGNSVCPHVVEWIGRRLSLVT